MESSQNPSDSLLLRNIKIVYAFNFFRWFLIIIAVAVPFFKSKGMNMHQVFQLQSIFAITLLLLEIPSGYLSDIWGRKRTLFLGSIFMAFGNGTLLIADNFLLLALYEVFLAISASLISGTDTSLLYDSLKYSKKKFDAKQIIGNNLFSSSVAESIAAVIGGIIAIYSLQWVVTTRFFIVLIPFFLCFFIVEPPIQRMDRSQHWQNLKKIMRILFLENREIRIFILNNIVWASATLIAVWSFQHYWDTIELAIIHFGSLWAAYNLTVAFTAKFAQKFQNKLGAKLCFLLIGGLPIVGYFGMASTTLWFGIFWGFCFQMSRGLNQVLIRDAFNKRLDSSYRATANSITSLGVRLIFCLAGPAVGWFFDRSGTANVFYMLSLVYALLLCFCIVPMFRLLKTEF